MEREDSQNSSTNSERKKATKRRILAVVVAILLIAGAIILCLSWKKLIINRVLKIVELKPGSEGFTTWLNPPTHITRGYHLFNITNPIDVVLDPTPAETVLRLKETRPYSYVLTAKKQDVQWSADNSALSYSIYRVFQRHPERFDQSQLSDTGTFVDLLRAIFRTQYQTRAASTFFDIAGNDMFYHRNAVEQLEGFTSSLFYTMQDKMTGPNTAKSGFIYRYNGSRSYNYTIKTALMEKGRVLAFANENVPFAFTSPPTYNFPIYDGLTFVPMTANNPSLNIFQADFCRPIRVQFNRALSMFGGIDVHEFTIKLVDFHSCTDPSDDKTCPEVDKLDVSKCISASLPDGTVYLSKPHFYGSSNETMNEMNIDGFTPARDRHESIIYFEPYSGTPLRAHHRVQLNIDAQIDPMRYSSEDNTILEPTKKKAIRRVIPLVWIDQEVNIDDNTISRLRMVHRLIRYGPWVIVALAIVLATVFIAVLELLAKRAAKKNQLERGYSPKLTQDH